MHVGTHRESISAASKHRDKTLNILDQFHGSSVSKTEVQTALKSTSKKCSISKLRRHGCSICSKHFLKKIHLREHMMSHTKVYPFKCDTCERTFRRNSELKQHKCLGNDLDGGNQFLEKDSLKRKNVEFVSCNICNKPVPKRCISKHRMSHAKEHVCKICKKRYPRPSALKEHMNTHTGERPFICAQCGKSFTSRSSLYSHRSAHSSDRPFACTMCHKDFKWKHSLQYHVNMHEQIIKGTKESEKMKEHIHVVNILKREESETHQADVNADIHLHGSSVSKTEVQTTLKSSTKRCSISKLRRHGCSVCGKHFLQKVHLKEHMISHTKVYPFKCDVCERTFRRNSELKQHKCLGNDLDGGNQFLEKDSLKRKNVEFVSCNICNKPVPKRCISKHRMSHAKKHVCKVCKKSYPRPSALKEHMNTHTGERPFICAQCGQSFTSRSSLYIHRSAHSSDRPFTCIMCHKDFKRKHSLQYHVNMHHTDNEQIIKETKESEKVKQHIDNILNHSKTTGKGSHPFVDRDIDSSFIMSDSSTKYQYHTEKSFGKNTMLLSCKNMKIVMVEIIFRKRTVSENTKNHPPKYCPLNVMYLYVKGNFGEALD